MKKLLFVLAATASLGMVSCTSETTREDGTNRGETEDVSHNAPIDEPTTPIDSTTLDVGIDSTDVVPEPEVVSTSDHTIRTK